MAEKALPKKVGGNWFFFCTRRRPSNFTIFDLIIKKTMRNFLDEKLF
jgi:hypothetical protein